jgi:hypothetical protein
LQPVCTPTVQWDWDGPTRSHDFPQAGGTPIVVQLTDDNGDGLIDANDTPDVVFLHDKLGKAVITAVDGRTGDDLFTISEPKVYASLAAGDIDNDGIVELISIVFPTFPNPQLQLVAFEHTGELKWVSEPAPATPGELYWEIGIADLDQDGASEIFAGSNVFNADGTLRWIGTEGRGNPSYGVANAVDLVPENPGLELLAGRTVYGADGHIIWNNPDLPDGLTSVGDFNGDGVPEIVLVDYAGDDVFLVDHAGSILGRYRIPGAYFQSKPVIADFDGDLVPEIFVNTLDVIEVLEWTGTDFAVKWSFATNDSLPASQGSAFDFDGDGASELVYRNEEYWYIFDGATGAVLSQIPYPSATIDETPVIADIDNDGLAEIVIGSSRDSDHLTARRAMVAWECASSNRPRSIWNQFTYHVCNVNDDGTIPQFEAPPWLVHNSWIAQAGPGDCMIASDEDEDTDEEADIGDEDENRG